MATRTTSIASSEEDDHHLYPVAADENTSLGARNSGRSYSAFSASVSSSHLRRDSDDDEHDSDDEPDECHSVSFFGKLGAIELENKGSVARDHLALERTFLAWLRTSLAFASIGIAITQLFRLNSASVPSKAAQQTLKQVGKPLGATFLGIAVLVLMIGTNRYYESQAWLLQGKFPASRGSVFLLTLVSVAVIVVSLVIVLTVGANTYET